MSHTYVVVHLGSRALFVQVDLMPRPTTNALMVQCVIAILC